MHEFFKQDIRKQQIYVLHGLGGAGKTQIALKFIDNSSYFTDKFFLDASTVETISTGLKEIAAVKNAGNSTQDALKWLVDNHEKWLLFFDNADDLSINLNAFLPQCNHGNIVITSRNPELCVYAGVHSPVSDMEETDAVALLLKSAAQEPSSANESVAAEIVKELCYLPLAIAQAGAFISQTGALDSYLDLYMQNSAQLLNEKPTQSHDNYSWTVYTTWRMSFDKLSQPAAMFLQLCSFLYREGISEEIFSRAAKYTFPSSGPSKEELEKPLQFLSQFLDPTGQWDSLGFLKVTNEIKAYSLVTFDPEKKVFSIHPLVHGWSQTTI
ncbi:P-loop containing nucleoside triphosphate hydrolase protein, partial [Mycena leptocephala]